MARRHWKAAKKMGIEYEDLISEGMIGLIKALKRFDQSYGVKFSTYAVPTISGAMGNFIRNFSPGIKYSRTVRDLSSKVSGKETVEDVMEQLKLSRPIAKELLAFKARYKPLQLEQVIKENLTVLDLLGIHADYSSVYINDFISRLDEQSQMVLKGILTQKSQTEIARELGISQGHVSRIKRDLPYKLKSYQKGAAFHGEKSENRRISGVS